MQHHHFQGSFNSLTVLVVLAIFGALVFGQDEYMTCSRPIKSSRSGRYQIPIPCREMENGKGETWCNLPGPDYPWHAVRRFVFENQGLMRRMYGEVRQLSVLRMEFSGENNHLDDARNFDEIFKPVTPSSPAMENLMSTSGISEPGVSRSISVTSEEIEEELEQLTTTLEFKMTTTEETPAPVLNETEVFVPIGNGSLDSTVVDNISGDALSTGVSGGDSTDDVPTTTEKMKVDVSESSSPEPGDSDSEEKNRKEGQVLFQDFEKSSTTTTEEPKLRGNRPGVNACPVKEEVVAPYWANNTRGEILALLNLYPFEQYIHWEKCTNEHRQMYCRDGCRCEQQYRLHRLLAFDPHNECRGIFSDWFRFPSCCVCKCYFDEFPPERVSFNRSPRILLQTLEDNFGDEPDVNGVDGSHFYYKYTNSFRQPRK